MAHCWQDAVVSGTGHKTSSQKQTGLIRKRNVKTTKEPMETYSLAISAIAGTTLVLIAEKERPGSRDGSKDVLIVMEIPVLQVCEMACVAAC